MTFRTLTASEIDVRISQVTDKGITLLLYKDARVDMAILDETVGPMNWQRKHEFKDGKLYCDISIWDTEKSMWIHKEDVGTESNTEAEKGRSSDSFKRAGFNWGIGRELYTAPFIFVQADKVEWREKNGKKVTYDKFHIEKIAYNDQRQITGISIQNQRKERVFVMHNG